MNTADEHDNEHDNEHGYEPRTGDSLSGRINSAATGY
jgi:hypothetical protein